jgi:tripartite-type tricarboxylate transporter receptor subunit TctC
MRLHIPNVGRIVPLIARATRWGQRTAYVAPALAVQSLDDLVKLARSKPDELTYASLPGAPDLAFRALQKRADISMRFVPYRNPLGAIPDLMANRIQVAVLSLTTVLELARDEKLKLLAVGARARVQAYPELPTAIEVGHPDFLLEGGLGLFGPRSMPFDQRLHLAADVGAALREIDTARKLGDIGYAIRATNSILSPVCVVTVLRSKYG